MRFASSVTYCLNGGDVTGQDRRRLEAYGVRVVDGRVVQVTDGQTDALTVRLDTDDPGQDPETDRARASGHVLECGAVFVAPVPAPHDDLLTMLGVEHDPETGTVQVGAGGATSVRGLFAAGTWSILAPRSS